MSCVHVPHNTWVCLVVIRSYLRGMCIVCMLGLLPGSVLQGDKRNSWKLTLLLHTWGQSEVCQLGCRTLSAFKDGRRLVSLSVIRSMMEGMHACISAPPEESVTSWMSACCIFCGCSGDASGPSGFCTDVVCSSNFHGSEGL